MKKLLREKFNNLAEFNEFYEKQSNNSVIITPISVVENKGLLGEVISLTIYYTGE